MILFVLICGTQFWLVSAVSPTSAHQPQKDNDENCAVSRLKCAYRVGCGTALQEYMVQCADVIAGKTLDCSSNCKRSLIALTSTEEGQTLMQCKCGDDFCRLSKQRIEVCRPEVTWAVATGTVVSCAVAQWICIADHLCSTALNFYNRFCRGMFEGHRCTARCNNSVAILNRQEKAAKLRDCYCDGTENFPCHQIKSNTDKLCFGHKQDGSSKSTGVTTEMDNSLSPIVGDQEAKQHRRRSSSSAGDLRRTFCSWWTALLLLVSWSLHRS